MQLRLYFSCSTICLSGVQEGETMRLGEKLKELRTAAGLTQAGLAEASGRGLGAIRDYEQGNREPLLSTAFKIAEALGVSVEVFRDCAFKDDTEPAKKPKRGRPPGKAVVP